MNYLKTDGRSEVSRKIAAARDEGDLSENGGYHAAREEQGQMEARILQLEQLLRDAQVSEAPVDTNEAQVGTLVTVAYFGDEDDTETFLLGSREMMTNDDSIDTAVFSPQSPLGAAVLGAKIGQEVSYQTPAGKTISVTVLKIEAHS